MHVERVRRVLLRTALVLLVAAGLALAAFLPLAGRYLVFDQPLERADAVFVLAGTRAERWMEASRLARDGWAPRIVLSQGRLEEAEWRLREMGVRFPSDAELARDALLQMGMAPDAVILLPDSLDNTAQEAAALRRVVEARGWNTVIVVTSPYHTRRTAFAFARAFRESPVRIVVRAVQGGSERPARWWTRRADFRYVTSELQKLLAYRLGLGE